MRIVIDMQGAQTESRFRGIGRYTMSFAQAVARNRGDHEIFLALSGLFPDTIEPICSAFDGLLPRESIRVWHTPGPVREDHLGNESRRGIAEVVREAFIASLCPDVIHLCSLFEGYLDDAVTSIGRLKSSTPVSVTLHDLIPLLNPDQYLVPNPEFAAYYHSKLYSLKNASLFIAISDSSRREVLTCLDVSEELVVNASEGADPLFQPLALAEEQIDRLLGRLGLSRSFVLYTGGADERKNLPNLIDAWSKLPTTLRQRHQLLFVGQMPDSKVTELRRIAECCDLQDGELVFSGYVSDEELVQLYNLCRLYVFPSWHEGFGLPVLEAMACGAPVIAANTSSLPEVVGLDEALFDPFDVRAMTAKISLALEDDAFRSLLREHGLQQAKKFSWDATARCAIATWESLPVKKQAGYQERTIARTRLFQALAKHAASISENELINLSRYLAQNELTGIERQLLLDVSELCQRDAATGVQRVVRSYLKWLLHNPPEGFRIEPVYATCEVGYHYARAFTQRFLGSNTPGLVDEPVRWQRGDIFFGLDMQHRVQLAHADFYQQIKQEGVTVKFLVHDLLPIQLAALFKDSDAKELHEQWLSMIATTDGAICISQTTADTFDLWIKENNLRCASTFRTSWVHIGADIEGSNPSSGLPEDAEHVLNILQQRATFLCVSTVEPRKCQQQILEAIEQLWDQGIDVNLVLVGQLGWKVEHLAERLCQHFESGKRLFWLRGISDEYLSKIYAASTCLIAASINEGFGLSLIEAARHGIPVVARDIPVFREVAGEHAFYFNAMTANDLASALLEWLNLYRQNKIPQSQAMLLSTWQQSTEKLKTALVTQNYPRRQLLVDISELVHRDAKSGIQRVVRSILNEWLNTPPDGYRVEPVYATVEGEYRYARRFAAQFTGIPGTILCDEPIDYAVGDLFFVLDLQPQVQIAQRMFYQALRRAGVRVIFLVHDLLCVQMPQYFVPGSAEGFQRWLDVVAKSDGAVCVSETTARELNKWVSTHVKHVSPRFEITWSHNGANLDNSVPTTGVPANWATTLDQFRVRPTFLMVGTLEPRKGHIQALEAFEQLWQCGVDINLAIVGKQGWMVEKLVERLNCHPHLNERLFWLAGVSDEYLEKIYAACTCLIAASYGEGFGLPLIEAAQHKLPIMARDIPVFREVAGQHALFFTAETPRAFAEAIKEWLRLYERGEHPKSDGMSWLSWRQSAALLADRLLKMGNVEGHRG